MKKNLFTVVSVLVSLFVSVSCSAAINDEAYNDEENRTIEEAPVSLEELKRDAIYFKNGIQIEIILSEKSFTTKTPTNTLLAEDTYLIMPHNAVLWSVMDEAGVSSLDDLEWDILEEGYAHVIEDHIWNFYMFLDGELIKSSSGHNFSNLENYPETQQIATDGDIEFCLYDNDTGKKYYSGIINKQ